MVSLKAPKSATIKTALLVMAATRCASVSLSAPTVSASLFAVTPLFN